MAEMPKQRHQVQQPLPETAKLLTVRSVRLVEDVEGQESYHDLEVPDDSFAALLGALEGLGGPYEWTE